MLCYQDESFAAGFRFILRFWIIFCAKIQTVLKPVVLVYVHQKPRVYLFLRGSEVKTYIVYFAQNPIEFLIYNFIDFECIKDPQNKSLCP